MTGDRYDPFAAASDTQPPRDAQPGIGGKLQVVVGVTLGWSVGVLCTWGVHRLVVAMQARPGMKPPAWLGPDVAVFVGFALGGVLGCVAYRLAVPPPGPTLPFSASCFVAFAAFMAWCCIPLHPLGDPAAAVLAAVVTSAMAWECHRLAQTVMAEVDRTVWCRRR